MRSSSSATLFFAAAIFSAVVINKKGVLYELFQDNAPTNQAGIASEFLLFTGNVKSFTLT